MAKRLFQIREEIKALIAVLSYLNGFLSKYNPRVTKVGINIHTDRNACNAAETAIEKCSSLYKHLSHLIRIER